MTADTSFRKVEALDDDFYSGTLDDLAKLGIVARELFPGQPGRPLTKVSIRPCGEKRGRFWFRVPGYVCISRTASGRYQMRVTISDNERERRHNEKRARVERVPREIRSREDLSFTKRDAEGGLINWFVPSRQDQWHEHYGIGEVWFSEIVELARHNPEAAYNALRFAGPLLLRHLGHGHEDGFFDRMARWAIAAILATKATEPALPFEPPNLGKPPLEGVDFYLAAAQEPTAPASRKPPPGWRVIEGRRVD